MQVTINGVQRELPAHATVADLVEALADAPEGRGVAVALDGTVVARAAWPRTAVREGAQVELVAAVQGG